MFPTRTRLVARRTCLGLSTGGTIASTEAMMTMNKDRNVEAMVQSCDLRNLYAIHSGFWHCFIHFLSSLLM